MKIKPLVQPVLPGSQDAKKQTIISGKKTILEIENIKESPIKSVLKKLMLSSVWGSNTVNLTWKTRTIKTGNIILQLVPSKPKKEKGMHPTMIPTPTQQDGRIGTNNVGGNEHRTERGSIAVADVIQFENGKKTDMKLQPEFLEWMMGLPIGWTDISEPSELIFPF